MKWTLAGTILLPCAAVLLSGAAVRAENNPSFLKSKLVEGGSQKSAQVTFVREKGNIVVYVDDNRAITVPCQSVERMTYSSAERHRVKEGVALGAATLGTGALLAASKSKSYYLEIAYREHDVPKSLTLRLHKDEWERFLQVARAETGKPVDFDAGEAPPAHRGAAAPTAANAPAADGVAGLIALCQKGMVGLTLTGLDDGAAFKVDAVNSSTLPLRITLPKGDATVKLPQDLGTLTLTSPEERTLTLDPRGTVSFTLAQTGPQRVVKGSVTMRPVRGGMAMSMSSWSVRIEPTGSGKQQ